MSHVDFLPAKYRERGMHRKNHWRRGVVVAALVGLLAAGWYALRLKRARVEEELAAAQQAHDAMMQQTTELAKLAAQVHELRSQAELVAYLRHPWSRARIIRTLLAPLPEDITLQEIRISRNTDRQISQGLLERVRPHGDVKASDNVAQADLQTLRRQAEERPAVVHVAGLTAQHAVLHRYLGEIGKSDLFTHVELLGIEPQEARAAGFRFSVRLTLLPGYGQHRGPSRPPTSENVADPTRYPPATLVANGPATKE
jgi:hypothetical protein